MHPALFTPFVALSVATALWPTRPNAQDLKLTKEQIGRLEIRTERIRPADVEPLTVLAGTIVPAPNSRIAATAPFSGTVLQVHVLPGQKVEKGALIATISSRDLLEAESQLAQAEAQFQIADATGRRLRTLADKNYQNPTLADEAEAQTAKIKAVIDKYRAMISLRGIVPNGDGDAYGIPSQQAGTIVDVRVQPGDRIEAMDAVVSIDTSLERWIEIQVPAKLVNSIKTGESVRTEQACTGHVVSIGQTLEKKSRSAKLYASVPDDCGLLPGQLVSVTIERPAESGAVSVPTTAVSRLAGDTAVFVRNDNGFTRTPVELKGHTSAAATVIGSFSPDDEVASSGLPQLEQMLTAE